MRRLFLSILIVFVPFAASGQGNREPAYEDPVELEKLIRSDSTPYYLVDVRTPDEYASGHLPTAANIPVTDIGTLPPTADKGALIIVYCQSGRRSELAKKALDELGYTHVVNFGSITRWTGELVPEDQSTAD